MKKKFVTFVSLILVVFILSLFNENKRQRQEIYINWDIYFYEPKKIEKIFKYNYREGEDFLIWLYNSRNFDKTLSKNNFNLIGTKNVKSVEEYLLEFSNRLDNNEKELFDKNVKINSLISPDNYYLYKDKIKDDIVWENRNFVIIIAVSKTKEMYYFNAIW